MANSPINCPICGNTMHYDGAYIECDHDPEHAIHVEKEYTPYENGEKDINWLRFRMKVRVGKNKQIRKSHLVGK